MSDKLELKNVTVKLCKTRRLPTVSLGSVSVLRELVLFKKPQKSAPARLEDTTPDPLRDLVSKEARQHAKYIPSTTKEGTRRAYNTTGNNLDIYLKKGSINKEQHSAGMQLYKDFFNSRLIGGMKSCLNVTIGGRGKSDAGLNFQAYESFITAVNEIRGKRAQKLVINVCCIGEWLKDINNLSIAPHRRLDALQRGLDDLRSHYEARYNRKKVNQFHELRVETTMTPKQ